MKVILKDKRNNPRIIFIDGKRYILPSNKEVIKDISRKAYLYLSQCAWIEVKKYIEPEIKEPISEEEGFLYENKEPQIENKEPQIENKEPQIENKEPQIENKEPQIENKEPQIEEHIVANPLQDPVNITLVSKEEVNSVEENINYTSMSKKELKNLIEEKGGDPTGMSKANMLDWLKNN